MFPTEFKDKLFLEWWELWLRNCWPSCLRFSRRLFLLRSHMTVLKVLSEILPRPRELRPAQTLTWWWQKRPVFTPLLVPMGKHFSLLWIRHRCGSSGLKFSLYFTFHANPILFQQLSGTSVPEWSLDGSKVAHVLIIPVFTWQWTGLVSSSISICALRVCYIYKESSSQWCEGVPLFTVYTTYIYATLA